MARRRINKMPMTRDEFQSMLGEGFHTGFRKAAMGSEADRIWRAIRDMDRGEWGAVLQFVTWGFEQTYNLEWKEAE